MGTDALDQRRDVRDHADLAAGGLERVEHRESDARAKPLPCRRKPREGVIVADPRYTPIAWQDLRNGQHRGVDGKYFTTAYLHHPAELEPELFEAGFRDMRVLAIEGPGWLLQDFQAQWADANLRETILEVVRRTEAEPSLLGASSHLMAVGRKSADARQSSGDDGRATQ